MLTTGGWNSGNGDGIVDAEIFNSTTQAWTKIPDMHLKRWYPTTATLGNGKILTLSGMQTNSTWANNPEVYDPATNSWTLLNGINTGDMKDLEYVYIFKKTDGKMYVVSPYQGTLHNLDIVNQTWTSAGTSPIRYGSLVQYDTGKVLMTGGAQNYRDPSQKNSSVIDLTQGNPAWRSVANMAHPRYMHNLVALPDGKVMAIGGSRTADLGANDGVLEGEIWNPTTETWTTVASMSESRNYHSVAMLFPDARVLVAGGGRYGGATDRLTYQMYSPPYLFKGARPVISNAPTTAQLNSIMNITSDQANSIAKVVMVSLPTVTHTVDMNQHILNVSFTKSGNTITINTPSNVNLAPPGYYMVFILDQNGVPSVSKIVKFEASTGATPTPSVTTTPTPTTTPIPSVTPTPTLTATPTPTPVGELVASYNFNEGYGTTINDRSGNLHTGTVNGTVVFQSGKYSSALLLNGTNNYVSINDTNKLDLTDKMTVEAWVNPSSLSGWRTAVLKAASDHLAYGLYANTNLNNPHAEINSGAGIYTTEGFSQISLNTWTHIAMTYDKNYLRIYVNGALASQKYVTNAIQVTSGKLFIGGNTVWGEYFKGLIDDVRIYNKTLNQAEIQTDMNTPIY